MEVIVFVGISVDGFIARSDGSVDFLEPDEPFEDDMGFSDLLERVDCLLMGRSTFDFVMDAAVDWPYGETPVFVATHRSLSVPDELRGLVHAIFGSPEQLVHHMAEQGIDRVYLDGGNLAQQFFRAGLVDEVTLTIAPRLIGSGIRIFDELHEDQHLVHESTTTLSNGYVQLTYRS